MKETSVPWQSVGLNFNDVWLVFVLFFVIPNLVGYFMIKQLSGSYHQIEHENERGTHGGVAGSIIHP